jgi:hypothetical protein
MVTSVSIKSLVAALAVKVSAIEASFVVLPEDTVEEVIVIVGAVLSKVQSNVSEAILSLFEPLVKVAEATSIVHAPLAVGVKVAV